MKDIKELFSKKKKIGDNERDAKMSVLKDVSDMAGSAMNDKLKGLKKVSVASNSPEGLNQGLDKAKELLNKDLAANDSIRPDHHEGGAETGSAEGYPDESDLNDEEESPEHEASESPKLEESEHEDKDPQEMDSEELKSHIEELKKLLSSKE